MCTITGFDPGSNFVGVATLHLNDELELVKIETETINLSKVEALNDFNHPITHKMEKLLRYLMDLMKRVNPDLISIENPFMFSKRPGAVIPLAKSLGAIELASIMVADRRYIHRISPSEAKNAIGAKGNAKKEEMEIAIQQHSEISQLLPKNISEHEIDATAIAFGLVEHVRKNPYLLIR